MLEGPLGPWLVLTQGLDEIHDTVETSRSA